MAHTRSKKKSKWELVKDPDGNWYKRYIKKKIKLGDDNFATLLLEESYFPHTQRQNLELIDVQDFPDYDDMGYWRKKKIKVK